jgi:hypothetical protein
MPRLPLALLEPPARQEDRMIDSELSGLAMQGLNMAKRDLEQEGARAFNFLLASHFDNEGLKRMRKLERVVIEKLGANWLNSGRTKDIGFGLVKMATALAPPDALVLVTVCNMFQPTEALKKLGKKQAMALLNAGHDRHHRAVGEGLLTVVDALVATAQTAERVCLTTQHLMPRLAGGRGFDFDGQPKIGFMPQTNFEGRTKFYGCDPSEYSFLLPGKGEDVQ